MRKKCVSPVASKHLSYWFTRPDGSHVVLAVAITKSVPGINDDASPAESRKSTPSTSSTTRLTSSLIQAVEKICEHPHGRRQVGLRYKQGHQGPIGITPRPASRQADGSVISRMCG